MIIFFIYIVLIFVIANLYYFLFPDRNHWKKKMLYVLFSFSSLLLVTDISLSIADSDDLVRDIKDFFIFFLFSNILLIACAFFLLAVHNLVLGILFPARSYGTYIFVFMVTAFFGCLLLFFVLYILVSALFGFAS
ncbi:hypothetical protein ACM40_12880 [Chryseobacterium sp. BLS98]|nr:hypothetical protein ACM40_12880 [Chryseobacterium sp. BLS98]